MSAKPVQLLGAQQPNNPAIADPRRPRLLACRKPNLLSPDRAHHLIPLEAEKKFGNLLERGRRGGFDINGANNGRLVDPTDHIGGHPQYNKDVLNHIESINDAAKRGGLSDGDIAELLQDAADTLGTAIDNGTYGPWG